MAGFAVAAVVTALTLRTVRDEDVPKVSVVTAAVFIASLVHIPIGVAKVHLLLNGLAGILLGYAAFPSILVALLFQAIMFSHGGLTVLGVNAVVMGFPALFAFWLFRMRKFLSKKSYVLALSFSVGVCYVALTVLLYAFVILFAGREGEFATVARLVIIGHISVMIMEGIICLFTVKFLLKVKPQLIEP